MRKIIKGNFCVQKFRFRAAEAFMKLAFDQNDEKKTEMLKFNDKILQKLDNLVIETNQKKKIDLTTCNEFKKMLLPSEGINISNVFPKQQILRLQNAMNKNHLMTFSFDPIMLCLILKQMYKKQNGKFKLNPIVENAAYIVGTPGLGKSIKFIAAKILLDCRVREIIKNGQEEDSIFAENYKFFYFHIQTNEQQIMLKVLSEVKRDFDYVPEQISQINADKQNFQNFISKVSSAYSRKKIGLRLIIDQINSVYKLGETERKYNIDKWKKIREQFVRPAIMISSKNNPYLEKYDPVVYFANSYQNDVKHKKVILDNFITPKQKLNYSYSCLIFELEKYINRNDTMRIFQSISIPILTHLSITSAVRNIFGDFNSQEKLDDQKLDKLCENLQKQLNSFSFISNFNKMIGQLNEKPQQLQQQLETISQFLSFSCKDATKEQIKLHYQIKNKNGEVEQIQKTLTIPKKEFSNQQTFAYLKQINYFFINEKNRNKYVYYCASIQKLEQIRMEIMDHVSTKYLQELRRTNESLFKKFIKTNAGYIFQGFICNLYKTGLKNNVNVQTQISQFNIGHIAKTMSSNMFSLDEEQSYKTLFMNNNQFIKSVSGNAAFDFILTQCQANNKRIMLVDTTISAEVEPIITKLSKFKRILFEKNIKSNKTNFHKEILKLLEQNKECKLQIICFVFTAIQSKGQVNMFSDEQFYEQEQKILKNLMQRAKKERKNEKIKEINKDIQNIIKGRSNFDNFQNTLREQNFDKRVKVIFMKGHIFIYSNIFSVQLSSEIKELPKYIAGKHKEALENKEK